MAVDDVHGKAAWNDPDYIEAVDELNVELESGDRAALELAAHLRSMGASSCSGEVELDGVVYDYTIKER